MEEEDARRKLGINDLVRVTEGVRVRRASVVVRRASGREGFEVLSSENAYPRVKTHILEVLVFSVFAGKI